MKHLREQFIRGTTGTFLLKITTTGLTFITSLILARILKAEGLGIFSYAMAWVFILLIPSVLGTERLLIREVSGYCTRKQWSLLKGLIYYARVVVFTSSLIVVFTVALFVLLTGDSSRSVKLEAFLVSLFLVPLRAMSFVHECILKGLQRIVIAQVPEMVVQPVLFLILVLISYFFLKEHISPVYVIELNIIVFAVVAMMLYCFSRQYLPEEVKNVTPEYRISQWIKSGLVLLLITGMGFINERTDIIMLGAMKEAKTVGIYSVANAGASLVSFVLFSVNTTFGPILARLYKSGERKVLQREITFSARVAFLFSLPIALILIIFGKWFLLLYGEEFTAGSVALAILCLGQLINVSAGSVGLILVMTGHEKEASMGLGLGALVNIMLNFLLIPKWSKEGAAVATAVSILVWNAVMAWFVWKRLGLYTTALGNLRRLRVWKTSL